MIFENLREIGLEVLHWVNLIDEYGVQQLKKIEGKKLESTTKGGLELDDGDAMETLERCG